MDAPIQLLGILTASRPEGEPPFASQRFYRQLMRIGSNVGIDVFVFTPDDVNYERGEINGFFFDMHSGQWCRLAIVRPFLVYDRYFPANRDEANLYMNHKRRIREQWGAVWMNSGLMGKSAVFRQLQSDSEIAAYLPRTAFFNRGAALLKWLFQEGTAFLKPDNGSQGRGTLLIERDYSKENAYHIKGRDFQNRFIQQSFPNGPSLLHWVRSFIGNTPYLIQQTLDLKLTNELTFDMRSLIQKNRRGSWSLTGIAVRQGATGSTTANIHGGGSAVMALPFLTEAFGEALAEQLMHKISHLSYRIAELLEQQNGRLTELGLDFGMDRQGRLWFLEGNSKPGRSAFAHTDYKHIALTSVAAPIRYAKWLLKHANSSPYTPELPKRRVSFHAAPIAANDDSYLRWKASPFPYE